MTIGNSQFARIPGNLRSTVYVKAHAAATATEAVTFWTAPFDAKIVAFVFTPLAAVTGDTTNRTNLNFIDRGLAGAGTTEIGNFDPITGTNLTAKVRNTLVDLSSAQYSIDEGDVVELQAEKVGTGVDIPEGVLEVIYRAD